MYCLRCNQHSTCSCGASIHEGATVYCKFIYHKNGKRTEICGHCGFKQDGDEAEDLEYIRANLDGSWPTSKERTPEEKINMLYEYTMRVHEMFN